MSMRKAIRSSFSDDVFNDYYGKPKLTTVGDTHGYEEEPDNYQGRRYTPYGYYAEKHKYMEGLPKILGGVWGPNGKEESRLKPGNLVVCAYLSHSPYGPSGGDKLGVIWKKEEHISEIKAYASTDNTSKIYYYVTTRFYIRSVKKDLTLGSVFEEYTYRCERIEAVEGTCKPKLHNGTRWSISKEREKECAMRKNVHRNFQNLKSRLIGSGVDKKNIY